MFVYVKNKESKQKNSPPSGAMPLRIERFRMRIWSPRDINRFIHNKYIQNRTPLLREQYVPLQEQIVFHFLLLSVWIFPPYQSSSHDDVHHEASTPATRESHRKRQNMYEILAMTRPISYILLWNLGDLL